LYYNIFTISTIDGEIHTRELGWLEKLFNMYFMLTFLMTIIRGGLAIFGPGCKIN